MPDFLPVMNPWAEMAQPKVAQNRGFKPIGPGIPSLPGEPPQGFVGAPLNINLAPPVAVEAPPSGNGNSVAVTGGGSPVAPPPVLPRREATKSQTKPEAAISDDDYQTMVDRINSNDLNSVATQRSDLDKLRDHLSMTQEMPLQMNLAPLAALADSWAPGSHMSAGYKMPETPEERMAAIAKLQEAIGSGQNNLSKIDMENLKTQLDTEERKQVADDRLEAARLRAQGANDQHALARNALDEARQQKLATTYQSNFNKDATVVDATKKLTKADEARTLLDQALTNPQARQSVGLAMATMIVPSRLNDREIQAFKGGQDARDKIGQIIADMQTGTLTPENYRYMSEVLEGLKASSTKDIKDRTEFHAGQYNRAAKVPMDQARDVVSGGRYGLLNSAATTTPQTASQGLPSYQDVAAEIKRRQAAKGQ